MNASSAELNHASTDFNAVDAEDRCRYPSKFCRNRRTHKSNGRLHRFCEVHRQRANRNQRRWNHTRRYREAARQSSTPKESVGGQKRLKYLISVPTARSNMHQAKSIEAPKPGVIHTQDLFGGLMYFHMADPVHSDGICAIDWDSLVPCGFVPPPQSQH